VPPIILIQWALSAVGVRAITRQAGRSIDSLQGWTETPKIGRLTISPDGNEQMTTSLRYREVAIEGPAESHVLNLWEFAIDAIEGTTYQHYVPPDGCLSIVIRYAATSPPVSLLIGPRTEPLCVPVTEGEHYFGLRFWPYSAESILGSDAATYFGFVGPTDEHLPAIVNRQLSHLPEEPAANLVRAALKEAANRMAQSLPAVDHVVQQAVQQIVGANGNVSIAELADKLRIGQRQLQRRFRACTGITPKQFTRIRRFRTAAAELLSENPRPWAAVAYESGYSDQSHLAREFSQLIGLTANQLKKKHEVIFHEDVEP
jgi:AraC-like DNA-binding protein